MEGLETKRVWGKLSKVYGGRTRGGVCESGGSGGACLRSPGHCILPSRRGSQKGCARRWGRRQRGSETGAGQQSPSPQGPTNELQQISGHVRAYACTMVVMYSGNARPRPSYRSNTRSIALRSGKAKRAVLLRGEDQGNQQATRCTLHAQTTPARRTKTERARVVDRCLCPGAKGLVPACREPKHEASKGRFPSQEGLSTHHML